MIVKWGKLAAGKEVVEVPEIFAGTFDVDIAVAGWCWTFP